MKIIENELHFLLDCPNYEKKRKPYLTSLPKMIT